MASRWESATAMIFSRASSFLSEAALFSFCICRRIWAFSSSRFIPHAISSDRSKRGVLKLTGTRSAKLLAPSTSNMQIFKRSRSLSFCPGMAFIASPVRKSTSMHIRRTCPRSFTAGSPSMRSLVDRFLILSLILSRRSCSSLFWQSLPRNRSGAGSRPHPLAKRPGVFPSGYVFRFLVLSSRSGPPDNRFERPDGCASDGRFWRGSETPRFPPLIRAG
jgi:hypothetical protein